MRVWRKVAIIVGMLLLGHWGAVVAAHAESTLDKARAAGFIRAGTINVPPYAYATMDGHLLGIGPEITTAVLKRLGIPQVDWVVTPFNALIPGLIAGRWDLVAAEQSIFKQRCDLVSFANPTDTGLETLLVKAGNPKNLHSYDDIRSNPNAIVASPSGTTELNYLHAYKVPDSRILIITNQADGAEVVRSGRADAYTMQDADGGFLMSSGRGTGLELAKPFKIPVVDGKQVISYGATTFRKDDTAFRDAYNKELAAFEKTPEFWDIEKRNGFSEEDVRLALQMTADQACKK